MPPYYSRTEDKYQKEELIKILSKKVTIEERLNIIKIIKELEEKDFQRKKYYN